MITYFSKQGDLRPRGRMVLVAESTVANLPARAHAFQVTTNAKELKVSADSAGERERWVAALDREIQRLKERALQRRSGRSVRCEQKGGGGERKERAETRQRSARVCIALLGADCHAVRSVPLSVSLKNMKAVSPWWCASLARRQGGRGSLRQSDRCRFCGSSLGIAC